MIKIALIGLGNMGSNHLKNILKLQDERICELVAICDINKELTDKLTEKINVEGYYTVEELLENSEFDSAIIAITSKEHYKVAKELIENRIHVLIEKPVVTAVEDAEKLKKLADKKKVLISAGFTEVYNSVVSGLKEYIDGNENSYLDFCRIGQRSYKNNYKDIDSVQDLMIHDIAVLACNSDISKVKHIDGYFSSFNEHSGHFDRANVTISLEKGLIARFIADRGAVKKLRKMSVSNEKVYGEFDFMNQIADIYKEGNIEIFGRDIWYNQKCDSARIRYSNNPLRDEIVDFIGAVENAGQTKTSEIWFEVTKFTEEIKEKLQINS